jgi:BolA protein
LKRKINIENLILKTFKTEFLSVIDVSEQHRGHKNFKEDVESHFEIIIVSEKFTNLSRIERHRMVNQILKEEFLSDLHSVVLKIYTSEEFKLT